MQYFISKTSHRYFVADETPPARGAYKITFEHEPWCFSGSWLERHNLQRTEIGLPHESKTTLWCIQIDTCEHLDHIIADCGHAVVVGHEIIDEEIWRFIEIYDNYRE